MKVTKKFDWIPSLESDSQSGGFKKNLFFSVLISLGLFFLLPLSEFIRSEEWNVREVESLTINTPPPTKTTLEKKLENKIKKESTPPKLEKTASSLNIESLSANLELGPGDFKSQFSLANFNPLSAKGLESEFVFALHELDKNPNILKRGVLRYPQLLKRKGVEGEVKLLIQIDEKGKVKVVEVVSFTHSDFVEPSKKAAESSLYESPTRNGESVKVQFYLPVRYTLLNQ